MEAANKALTPGGKPMKQHACIVCKYMTPYIGNMRKHLKGKRPCGGVALDDVDFVRMQDRYFVKKSKDLNFSCEHCGKQYKCRTSIYRHNCKSKSNEGLERVMQAIDKVNEKVQNITKGIRKHPHVVSVALAKQQDFSQIHAVVKVGTTHPIQIRIPRNELFYQRILEVVLHGKHMKTACGETDITTDAFHAEIKAASNWKDAIGQLLCYNKDAPRPELRLYLFGNNKRSKKIVQGAQAHGVNVYIIEDTPKGISVDDIRNQTNEMFEISFSL